MLRSRLMIAACLALLAAPAAAKDCRTKDAPPGVRVPAAPGCAASVPQAKPERDERLPVGRSAGSYTPGGGIALRMGGRVRGDALIRN
jgi:hypothetical protein